jgi:hypothetical protein
LKSKPVAISRSTNNYSKNIYTLASRFTIELATLMEQDGWIEQSIGYLNRDTKESRYTRIYPTKKFLDYFSPIPLIICKPVALVQLRNEKHKPVIYENTPEVRRIQKILGNANLVNSNALVQYKRQLRKTCLIEPIRTDLHAVFNKSSFKHGGRLYNGDGGYQNLSKKRRSTITINGQPTVELDFSGFHPRLLYAMEGIQYDDDPYTPVCGEYPELRPFVKKLLLALINAESIAIAKSVGNEELYYNRDLFLTLKKFNIRVADLIEKFKNVHQKIKHHLGTEVGFKLMNLDGKIALEIVEHFTSKNIPILAIHDSFIVTADLKEELKKVMQDTYRKHTKIYDKKHGIGFDCPVD